MSELWKDIEGFPCYQVSNLGRVRSNIKVLKPYVDRDGYETIHLYQKTKRRRFRVHRLVALYFCGNPENKKEVNHKNLIKTDNRSENLEWATRQENQTHAKDNGMIARGSAHKCSRLTEDQVREIKSMLRSKLFTNRHIAKMFNVSFALVSRIKSGEKWSHV